VLGAGGGSANQRHRRRRYRLQPTSKLALSSSSRPFHPHVASHKWWHSHSLTERQSVSPSGMLDENLPTFTFKAPGESAGSSAVLFSHHGSDAVVSYVVRRADPRTKPASRGKYALALADASSSAVVYGEVIVEPEWQQPSLSAAELRAQSNSHSAAAAAAPLPIVPDRFTIQLYNPDVAVAVRMTAGSWNRADAWEFEMPSQPFRQPSVSQLDRQQNNDDAVRDLTPKVMFKWKKDGRLSKDMTCYMVGKSLGRHKSKEPDITVALFKHGRDAAVTIYEPNLARIDVEDRKGLELVLLISAEVVKDLYVAPRPDPFNIAGASTPLPTKPPSSGYRTAAPAQAMSRPGADPPPVMNLTVDAETKRVQAMVAKEERERERRDREEQKNIRKMLEAEEKEHRRREAEVAKETEARKCKGFPPLLLLVVMTNQLSPVSHSPSQIRRSRPRPARPDSPAPPYAAGFPSARQSAGGVQLVRHAASAAEAGEHRARAGCVQQLDA
jgi:hypothetical protein